MPETLESILQSLDTLRKEFEADIRDAQKPDAIETVRVKYLGRKGGLPQYFKKMGALPAEQRPQLGDRLNAAKTLFQQGVDTALSAVKTASDDNGFVDLSLPGIARDIGHTNPLIQVLEESKAIFQSLGFTVEVGPEVETEYYNFEALNVPADHPARDLQDTFYLPDGYLLRTHTSPVQIRTMEKRQPPIRIIAPGRCFRKDTLDATHSPEFHQIEGLVVDEGISFAHMKGTLLAFGRKLLGSDVEVRFRPSFYPFTEPSADYDFSCVFCGGKNRSCRVCKGSGWLEISGCGMVNPAVFDYVRYDYEKYTGFAWGMGIERIAMMLYQVDDIRHFYENDLRFLQQF